MQRSCWEPCSSSMDLGVLSWDITDVLSVLFSNGMDNLLPNYDKHCHSCSNQTECRCRFCVTEDWRGLSVSSSLLDRSILLTCLLNRERLLPNGKQTLWQGGNESVLRDDVCALGWFPRMIEDGIWMWASDLSESLLLLSVLWALHFWPEEILTGGFSECDDGSVSLGGVAAFLMLCPARHHLCLQLLICHLQFWRFGMICWWDLWGLCQKQRHEQWYQGLPFIPCGRR